MIPHVCGREEQIEAEATQKQKERLALMGCGGTVPSPKVLTWEKLELLDSSDLIGRIFGYLVFVAGPEVQTPDAVGL